MDTQTFTITFGDQAENHVGMERIGQMSDSGFTVNDLRLAEGKFHQAGLMTELTMLSSSELPEAAILIVRNAVSLLSDNSDLFNELNILDWDKKAKMYGRVVNKNVRHNLCFSQIGQDPDYEEGKGRIVPYSEVPILDRIRLKLPQFIGTKAEGLVAEGNHYYDVNKTKVGFHGDSERKKVVAIRIGANFPLFYQWYKENEPFGDLIEFDLHGGDLYIMSEKAVGTDWKRKKVPTLRHAAGFKKVLGLK